MPRPHASGSHTARRQDGASTDSRRRSKEPSRRGVSKPGGWRFLTIAISAGFALGLLATAAPRLMAAAQVAEYGTLSERLGRQKIDGPELARAVGDHRKALAWIDDGKYRGDLGQIFFASARLNLEDPPRRVLLLEQAAESDRLALALDPGQPFLWTQLAVALAQTQGMDADFQRILKQAILVAPRTKSLVFARADLGLRAWPLLDAETRSLVTQQIALAVKLDPRRFRRSIPGPNHRRLVRHLLAEDPALVERFLRD